MNEKNNFLNKEKKDKKTANEIRGKLSAIVTGGLISSVLQFVYKADNIFSGTYPISIPDIILQILPQFIVGCLVGWIFGIAIDLKTIATKLNQELTTTKDKLETMNSGFVKSLENYFTEGPYSMLLKQTAHTGVIGSLIADSVKSGYKKITKVDENKYLTYLKEAIGHAERYIGIQKHPITWFQDSENKETYMKMLKDATMEKKQRIFIISMNDEAEMRSNIDNDEVMNKYFLNTDSSMESYWITEEELLSTYGFNMPIEDCAFYDKQLLIKYSKVTRILEFDLEPDSVEIKVFDKLEEQLRTDGTIPFKLLKKESK